MIQITARTNTQISDDLIQFVDSFEVMAAEIGERVFGRIQDDFLDELRYYPAPRPNQRYQRTFKLRDGWEVSYRRTEGGFLVTVANDVPYAKFVVGSLAQARAAAASFQAWMHKGRWPLATETVTFWLEAFNEEFAAEFQRELGRFGSTASRRRAFTR
jgi:hypothetical protein